MPERNDFLLCSARLLSHFDKNAVISAPCLKLRVETVSQKHLYNADIEFIKGKPKAEKERQVLLLYKDTVTISIHRLWRRATRKRRRRKRRKERRREEEGSKRRRKKAILDSARENVHRQSDSSKQGCHL